MCSEPEHVCIVLWDSCKLYSRRHTRREQNWNGLLNSFEFLLDCQIVTTFHNCKSLTNPNISLWVTQGVKNAFIFTQLKTQKVAQPTKLFLLLYMTLEGDDG